MSAPSGQYPEFANRWDDGLNVEALIATFWHRDGPHSADTIASAALAIDELTHYLARATFSSEALPQGGHIYRLITELRSALGRLDQILDQVSRSAGALAADPKLYDDRRDRPAVDTAGELQGALDMARVHLGPFLAKIGDAHRASGHLGHGS